jgi:hypothetical protein
MPDPANQILMNQFPDMMNVDVLPERVDRWCNVEGKHYLLRLVQENPQPHGMLFQLCAQLTMTQQPVQRHPQSG